MLNRRTLGLVFVFAVGGLTVGACGGSAELTTQPGGSDSTSPPATRPMSHTGLQCASDESEVGVQGTFGAEADGSLRVNDPGSRPEEAVENYRRDRFPRMARRPDRTGEREFSVRDDAGNRVMIISVERADNGWFVPGYRACQRFEEAVRR